MNNEIERLKKKLLALSAQVQQQLWKSVKSIKQRKEELAQEVIDFDYVIDQDEVEIEEDCLKILALYQPVAIDLRFIVTAFKINSDLERIGDLSVNIAERSVFLARHAAIAVPYDFDLMTERAQAMLNWSIDALVNLDCDLAQKVCTLDDELDALNKSMYDLMKDSILSQPEHIECLIHLLSASRHLERIGDHAVNIAEDVIYMVEGRIIRHQTEEY